MHVVSVISGRHGEKLTQRLTKTKRQRGRQTEIIRNIIETFSM